MLKKLAEIDLFKRECDLNMKGYSLDDKYTMAKIFELKEKYVKKNKVQPNILCLPIDWYKALCHKFHQRHLIGSNPEELRLLGMDVVIDNNMIEPMVKKDEKD